jgi:Mg2+-importing ATPase
MVNGSVKRARWPSLLVGLACLVAVTLLALHFSEERAFYGLVRAARPSWLLVAFALQAATYVLQGEIWRVVTRAAGTRLTTSTASWLSVGKLFVDQALPTGGLSGNLLMVRALGGRGVPLPVVMAGVVVDTASCFASYVLGLIAAISISLVHHQASALIVGASIPFALIGAAATVGVLALAGSPGGGRVGRFASRLGPLRTALDACRQADPELSRRVDILVKTCGYQLGILVLDAATIWTLVASLGARAAPSGVFASFMISTVFRIVGVIPGGLGVFEAASVLTLTSIGVTVPVALAATLLFRGLSFWLPMLPGAWLARKAVLAPKSSRRPRERKAPPSHTSPASGAP